jgi:DNA-binding NarL/FixJ family response regulator
MKKAIKIGIAEDQEIFRKGLILLINSIPELKVIIEAENGLELLNKIENQPVDVVVLDYSMSLLNGIETCMEVKKKFPEVKVLLLSNYEDINLVKFAVKNGANGYLSKDDNFEEIPNAILHILEHPFYMNNRMAEVFVDAINSNNKALFTINSNSNKFNTTELAILELMCKSYNNHQIAETLHKSLRTIEKHKSNMLEKANVNNSLGLIVHAIKNKIVKI